MMQYTAPAFVLGLSSVAVAQPVPTTQQFYGQSVQVYRMKAGTPDANGQFQAKSTGGHFPISLPLQFDDFTVPGTDANNRVRHTIAAKATNGLLFRATETPTVGSPVNLNKLVADAKGFFDSLRIDEPK